MLMPVAAQDGECRAGCFASGRWRYLLAGVAVCFTVRRMPGLGVSARPAVPWSPPAVGRALLGLLEGCAQRAGLPLRGQGVGWVQEIELSASWRVPLGVSGLAPVPWRRWMLVTPQGVSAWEAVAVCGPPSPQPLPQVGLAWPSWESWESWGPLLAGRHAVSALALLAEFAGAGHWLPASMLLPGLLERSDTPVAVPAFWETASVLARDGAPPDVALVAASRWV